MAVGGDATPARHGARSAGLIMRIALCAAGRLRLPAPERALVDDWLVRFDKTGRPLGLGPCREIEVEDRPGALLRAVPEGAHLIALDERGQMLGSTALAERLRALRADGVRELAFAIGGADGHDPALRARAAELLSFGPMVWPHKLARAMLAEQLYRAATILAGGPYHRA